MDKKQNEQKEQKQDQEPEPEQFIINDQIGRPREYDEENNQINMPQINSIGTNDNTNNETSVKKKTSKKTDRLSTTIDTAHKDIIIENVSLLDLENNGLSLTQYVVKKAEEIQQEERKKEIKEGENNENSQENDDDDSDSLKDIKVSEEDEETQKKREMIIEKMSKKYDEIVDIPGYNILNEEICKQFEIEKENDQ